MQQTTVERILQKRLNFKISRLPAVVECNYSRQIISLHILFWIYFSAWRFTAKIIFSVETAFRSSENVNLHDLRIWGSKNHHERIEHMRHNQKFECVLCFVQIANIWPFFISWTYCDMRAVYITIEKCPYHSHGNEYRQK